MFIFIELDHVRMSGASKHRLYFLLQSVSHRLKKRTDQLAMESGGMTTAQAAVLNIIIRDGSTSQAQVAKVLSQRESAITTMATRLLRADYITRERSEEDRRTWVLKPTRQGRAALKAMMGSLAEANALLDEAVSAKQMDALAGSLKDILAALDKPGH